MMALGCWFPLFPPFLADDTDQSDAKSLDLSYQVDDFKALCTSWQKYKDDLADLSSIGVQHVKK